MTLFSMGTVVLCHKWLRKQGKLDVQINVSWLKGGKNIIKIQELTLYRSPACHRTNTKIPNKSPGTAGRVLMQSLLCRLLSARNFKPIEFLTSLLPPTERSQPCLPTCDQEDFLFPHGSAGRPIRDSRSSKSEFGPDLSYKIGRALYELCGIVLILEH